jgi:quercetin dioxygenase-like cupin family protein
MSDAPLLVGDANAETDAAGAVWRLTPEERGLDANIVRLPAGDEIAGHRGPDIDVLIHVLEGSGTLETDGDEIALTTGALVWLPPRSQRRFVAGEDGLRYFSVHRRKPPLSISTRPA